MAWHNLSVIHFSIAVSHSSFGVWSMAKCVAQGCLREQTAGLVLLLHLLDMKSVLQTPRFQFSSQFTVITATSLPSCRHGNGAVKEQAEEYETWEMTDTWPHCDRDRRSEC